MRISDWSADVCSYDLTRNADSAAAGSLDSSAIRARTKAFSAAALPSVAAIAGGAASAAAARKRENGRLILHIGIIGTSAAFGGDPVDILGRVLDVARLAMDAILRVDDEFRITFVRADDPIDTGGAIALCRLAIEDRKSVVWGKRGAAR